MSKITHTWICKNCNEELENSFDCCWSCKSDKDGNKYEESVYKESKKNKTDYNIKNNTNYPTLSMLSTLLMIIGIVSAIILIMAGILSNESNVLLYSIVLGVVFLFLFATYSELVKLFVNIGDDVSKIKKHLTKNEK